MNSTDMNTAFALCAQLALSPTQIVRLIMELVESSGGMQLKEPDSLMRHCRNIIRLGVEAEKRRIRTVPFLRAFEETLRVKAHRSALTLRDIRYYMRRLMRETPGLAERPLRDISTTECAAMLERVYTRPSQHKKARAILSGVFTVGKKRGWIDGENPVAMVDIPHVEEKEIRPLSMPEIKRLLKTAELPKYQACAPALGLMFWAGLRPYETRRIRWKDIDFQEREVVVSPRHSKTGGGRHIPICEPLLKILQEHRPGNENEAICPVGWDKTWKSLRRAAGFRGWTQDILRHTYASYHAKMHHNLYALQLYMGHRDSALLQTRYVNMRGISHADARQFWLRGGTCYLPS